MTYSLDFRKRAVSLVDQGRKKARVARQFGIGRITLTRWCKRETLVPLKAGPKGPWKLDPIILQAHVEADPGAYRDERAVALGVSASAVGYGLKRLQITCKKNDALPRERRKKETGIRPNSERDKA
jgi:transposase